MPSNDSPAPRRQIDVPAASGSRAAQASRPHSTTGARRLEILNAATDVFSEQGFHNSSLAEIARRAGMTHAGILHHFSSKDQLLLAVLERRDATDVENLEGAHAPEGAAMLDHLVRTAEHNEERRGIVESYSLLATQATRPDHSANQWFKERYSGLHSMIADGLREAAAEYDPPESEIHDATKAVIGMMDGLQVLWLLQPEEIDMPASVRLVLDALVLRWRDLHSAV